MKEEGLKPYICEVCGSNHPIEEHLKYQEGVTQKQWDKRYGDEYPYREAQPIPTVREFFEKHGKELRGGKVLDLGCGNGRNLRYITRLGFETYGIDISETALAQLKETLKKENLKAEIQKGSFYNIPYKDSSFDSVISINVLQHNDWKGAERSFTEVSRVLKDDGLFLLSMRSTSRELPSERKDVSDKGITFIPLKGTKAGIMLHHYSRAEIEELASKNSLEILDIKEVIREGEGKWDVETGRRGKWIVTFKKEVEYKE